MKRSKINHLIDEAIQLFDDIGFKLPPFAFWSPQDWGLRDVEVDEIRDNALGWDVTDFGLGKYETYGLLLFTIRNGNYHQKEKYPKPYAEKIMVVKEKQVTPMHFHWKKCEDIIIRGGGNLVIKMFMSTSDEGLSQETFNVSVDGVHRECSPGEVITLTPGESICLEPYCYHSFYGMEGCGPVIVGEVSMVNDDVHDNRFLESLGRFPSIEEDEEPKYYLCTEYP